MSHFTYLDSEHMDRNSLCQGDILIKTDEMIQMLSEVHPYFKGENYRYFMVLTQSCDLVKRNGKHCRSPYISLAAVRSLEDLLNKEIKRNNDSKMISAIEIINRKKYDKYYQFVERLYNNTEPDYFFLYKDNSLGFNESMVAFLKVSIAIKSKEHYDKCLAAKKIELADEFKAKLGWLVGNIYSRVGTKDWTNICEEKARKELIKDELTSRYFFAENKVINELTAAAEGRSFNSIEEIAEFVDNLKIKSNYDAFLEIMSKVVCQYNGFRSAEEKEKFINKIKNTSAIKQLIKN